MPEAPDLARALPLPERARLELERRILAGEIAPGTRLAEQALAAELGISRGPLREALRTLEADGLVASGGPNQGFAVRQLSGREIAEIYDMRALVNGFACARLAERRSAAQLAALRARLARMERAIEAGDGRRYYAENLAFHDAVLDFAGHARAAAIDRAMWKEAHLTRRQTLLVAENRRASNAEHAAIVDALEAGDAAAARQLGEAHVLAGKRRWLALLGG
jgi:DNA-binding GntR family transcriptional regulator